MQTEYEGASPPLFFSPVDFQLKSNIATRAHLAAPVAWTTIQGTGSIIQPAVIAPSGGITSAYGRQLARASRARKHR